MISIDLCIILLICACCASIFQKVDIWFYVVMFIGFSAISQNGQPISQDKAHAVIWKQMEYVSTNSSQFQRYATKVDKRVVIPFTNLYTELESIENTVRSHPVMRQAHSTKFNLFFLQLLKTFKNDDNLNMLDNLLVIHMNRPTMLLQNNHFRNESYDVSSMIDLTAIRK